MLPWGHRFDRFGWLVPSSNDLVLEQLRELLAIRQKELEEGLSLRAVSRRLDEHLVNSITRYDDLEKRVRALELHDPVQTGRFQIPPPVAVPIEVRTREVSKRPTLGPWIKAAARAPLVKWGFVVVIIVGSNLMGRCGITLPPVPSVPAQH